MNSIEIKYFAMFREKADKESEVLENSFSTYLELYHYLNKKYEFGLPPEMIQVAVDDEFSLISSTVKPGARVVFIPPVAGG